ncbi:MAG: hypothetical protein WC632_06395 [Candidatus Margulisiibacteriota bacterium]
MKRRSGAALLVAILVAGALLLLAVFLGKMVYNNHVAAVLFYRREQAEWLAEAGLASAGVELVKNPAWYTDQPHWPAGEHNWLKNSAVGYGQSLGEGSFKVVREKDLKVVYAVGRSARAVVILKKELP